MNKSRLITAALILCLCSAGYRTQAQDRATTQAGPTLRAGASGAVPASNLLAALWRQKRRGFSLMPAGRMATNPSALDITPATAGLNLQVLGNGTLGRLTKWSGFTSSNSSISDSSIVEDKFFNVGIGMEPTESRLSVAGIIHSTGGFRFPDGTLMTTAGLTSVAHDASFFGIGTPASPLGISAGGVSPLHLANGAVTALKLATISGPGTGQVLGFNGSNLIWQTPSVGTITGVTAGAGMTGGGTTGNVTLGIANGGVNTLQLAGNAVTAPKIAPLQVVKSFNGLFDDVALTAGSNVTITPSGNTLTISSTGSIAGVTAGVGLMGGGTSGNVTIGIADGGVNTLQLTGNAVTAPKIASGQVVKSLNGLFDNVTLAAGANVTITPSGNTLTIESAGNGLTSVSHNATLIGDGTSAGPLGIALPLGLTGSAPGPGVLLTVTNTGFRGVGIRAKGGEGGAGVVGDGSDGSPAAVIAEGGIHAFQVAGLQATGGNATNPGGFGGDGVSATAGTGPAGNGRAGNFFGNVLVQGNFNVSGGTKNFMIDHPLDPENKYLYHAAIESSEVLNIYSGNVTTDENGDGLVTLPDWFEAINRDFRYQLTVIGTFAQAIVADEIKSNQFKIKTNAPAVRVSWLVTAIRSDAAIRKHPFKVEEEKPPQERGSYLSPEAYGKSEELGIEWARNPEVMKQMRIQREEFERLRVTQKKKETDK